MKKHISIFVSFSRVNKTLSINLLDRFRYQVAASRNFHYVFWRDTNILVGENWHNEIQQAISNCDAGLLLLSPAFLGSNYIDSQELPKFVGKKARPIIPVMLQRIDFDFHDLKGHRRCQIFRLDSPNSNAPKSYNECIGPKRDEFTQELFRQVDAKLAKLYVN